jgi:hypothetical protein
VKSAEKGGAHRSAWVQRGQQDQGQEKRHLLVDPQGLLIGAIGHCADIQDCGGGVLLLSTLFGRFPFLEKLFADGVSGADLCRHSAACKDRDRQTLRSGERLRDLARALDCRAVDRMAEPLSKTGQGIGRTSTPQPLSFSVSPPFDSSYESSAMVAELSRLTLSLLEGCVLLKAHWSKSNGQCPLNPSQKRGRMMTC